MGMGYTEDFVLRADEDLLEGCAFAEDFGLKMGMGVLGYTKGALRIEGGMEFGVTLET